MNTQEHAEQEPRPAESAEEAAEECPAGYRRPERNKRKKTFGTIALCLTAAAFLLLIGVAISLLLSYQNGTIGGSDIRLVRIAAIVCVVLTGSSLILAVTTFFYKKQKNGRAAAALVLSLLLLATCATGLYFYQYMLGNLDEDEKFNQLSKQDLNVVEVADDGEVVRETEPTESTMSAEELLTAQEQLERAHFDKTIEWEAIDYLDIPLGARNMIDAEPPEYPSYLLKGSDQITNYLLFGLDEAGTSDSIILLSVDRAHKKLKMISLPRDAYVWIEKWGTYFKLTYPYYWGGAEMAVATVNQNFYLDVTDYIAVDFEQLSAIVDMVGGVDVELDADEVYYLRNKQDGLQTGTNRLAGKAALSYARMRSSSASDNEVNRTGRQREVIISLMESVKKMHASSYPRFIRACLGMCTTSIGAEELLDIALEAVQENYTIESYALMEMQDVPYWGGSFGEKEYFYVVLDLQRASDAIYRTIYEDYYISGFKLAETIDESIQ